MSVNHRQRLEGVVRSALEGAAFKESYGYAVSQCFAPQVGPGGKVAGLGPAWLVTVTIRDGLAAEPVGHMFPVPGVLPEDRHFRAVAAQLLADCRRERDEKNAAAMAEAKGALQQAGERRGA